MAAAALAAGVTFGVPEVAIAQAGGFEHFNKEEWSLIGLTPEVAASANNGRGKEVDGLKPRAGSHQPKLTLRLGPARMRGCGEKQSSTGPASSLPRCSWRQT